MISIDPDQKKFMICFTICIVCFKGFSPRIGYFKGSGIFKVFFARFFKKGFTLKHYAQISKATTQGGLENIVAKLYVHIVFVQTLIKSSVCRYSQQLPHRLESTKVLLF